jgi:hypothetical protein
MTGPFNTEVPEVVEKNVNRACRLIKRRAMIYP